VTEDVRDIDSAATQPESESEANSVTEEPTDEGTDGADDAEADSSESIERPRRVLPPRLAQDRDRDFGFAPADLGRRGDMALPQAVPAGSTDGRRRRPVGGQRRVGWNDGSAVLFGRLA